MILEIRKLIENIISSKGFLSQNINQHTPEEIITHNLESLIVFFQNLDFNLDEEMDNTVIMTADKRNIEVTVSINKSIQNSNVIDTTVNPHDINSEKDFDMGILKKLQDEYRENEINKAIEALKEIDND